MADAESGPVVRIVRLLPASPEEVFAAWTDAESLGQWMSPYGQATATVDLRVGGRFQVTMLGRGREIEHIGEYREIDPPRRLVFTWRSEYTNLESTVVTVALLPKGGQTELVLTHELLPGEAVESHRQGWRKIIEQLGERLAVRHKDNF